MRKLIATCALGVFLSSCASPEKRHYEDYLGQTIVKGPSFEISMYDGWETDSRTNKVFSVPSASEKPYKTNELFSGFEKAYESIQIEKFLEKNSK